MNAKRKFLSLCFIILSFLLSTEAADAQPWIEDNHIFNPTGIPSLSFSQPRFYDLDNDGDLDMILGSTVQEPVYFKNTGSKTVPKFTMDNLLFADVRSIDAEMGVCVDIDADNDLDFFSGGYTGLHLYENVGSNTQPSFLETPNFFNQLTVGNTPVPTLADVDGDGDYDLAIGLSEDGAVKYYPNTGTIISPQFLESTSSKWFDVGLYAYPIFCDLDKDGDIDLLVGRDGFGFYYYQNIGTSTTYNWYDKSSLFQSLGGTTYWNSPSVVDLSGDGKNDIIFGTASGQIFYYTNSGTNAAPSWKENTTVFGGTIDIGGASSPVLYDYDADGDLDLISGSQAGNIKYFENTGSVSNPAWKENSAIFTNIKHSIYSAAAVGDLNNDGRPDIISGDFTGKLYLHIQSLTGFTATTTAMTTVLADGFACPRLIDFDKDGDLDLLVGRDDGTIMFYENIGTADSADWFEIPGFFGGIDVGSDAVPTLCDFDKDGDYDLAVGNISGDVKFYFNQTTSWEEDAALTDSVIVDQNAAPAFADLDNDGDYDLVLGSYEGTFSYFRNDKITAIKDEVGITPDNFMLFQNYPNPFNPSTTIEYQLGENSFVTLKMFDILGNEIKTLVNETKEKGKHVVHFTASSLPSGIYYYQLKAGDFVSTKKLLLLK